MRKTKRHSKANAKRHTQTAEGAAPEIKHGQVLLARVDELAKTLESTLAQIQPHVELQLQAEAIQASLNALEELRAGGDDLCDATAALLSQWLEANRYLAGQGPPEAAQLRMLKEARERAAADEPAGAVRG